jgi:UDP-N-acetylmuramate dehydrogenase
VKSWWIYWRTALKSDDICISGLLLKDEPMSRHTSLKVGGAAAVYAMPADQNDLLQLMEQLAAQQIPWLVIGKGYNLLVQDGGFKGAIISLEKLDKVELSDKNMLLAEAGAENLAVVRFAQSYGLGGISFISGIPGSMGGAVKMNAGAYGQSLLQHAVTVTLLENGVVREYDMAELDYGYRYFNLPADSLILTAKLKLVPVEPAIVEQEIQKDKELRQQKHCVGYPCAGSFFKNPPQQAAWKLIDAAGMRGARHGGAMVSELHSNFIVNSGNATAKDILELADKVKQAVLATSGVLLEEEVQVVGVES